MTPPAAGRSERLAAQRVAHDERARIAAPPPSIGIDTAADTPAEPRWPFGLTLFVALSVSALLWVAIFALGGVVYRWATV